MKFNRVVFAGILTIPGIFLAVHPAQMRAQTDYDMFENAFQATVTININNFVYTPITIPAGKRLVVQDVSLSGAATTTGSYVQPIVVLSASLANSGGDANVLRYFGPNQSSTTPGQYYADFETTVYADTLDVAPAFAGYTPSFMSFTVVITGFLLAEPSPPPEPTVSRPLPEISKRP